MMLETGTFDAASAMVLGAYVAQGLELEQDMSVVQLSANAATAFTVAPPCISTCISSTSTVISTTATQYRPLGYSHEEVTSNKLLPAPAVAKRRLLDLGYSCKHICHARFRRPLKISRFNMA